MSKIKSIVQYLVGLVIAGALLYYVFKDIPWLDFLERFQSVNYGYVILSFSLGLLAAFVRGYRWNLLFYKNSSPPGTWRAFLAVNVGYIANLLFPRIGEVVRCGFLQKSNRIPLPFSFGTVITERLADLLVLMLVILITLGLEFTAAWELLLNVMEAKNNPEQVETASKLNFWLVFFIVAFLIIALVALWFIKFRKKKLPWNKLKAAWQQVKAGLLSVVTMPSKNAFLISTLIIWILYFLMSYVMFWAIEPTSNLSWSVGMVVLVAGGLGMAAPVQGGIGTYHFLVSAALGIYYIAEADGVFFATLMHSTQFLMVLISGGISLLIGFFLKVK